jgi:LPXTG-site transpeptidase (sortase) family protein
MSLFHPLLKNGRKTSARYSSPSKLTLGISLLILGVILLFAKDRAPDLNSTFENEPVSIRGLSEVEVEDRKLPKKIIIPSLSVNLPVKKANVVDGYWEVFEDSAAWGMGSGIPGENGNQVIFAHARENLFLALQSIKLGEEIYILNDDAWFSYKVTEIKEVFPSQIEVIEKTEDQTLTLYTCSGYKDSKRLIVVAKRV